MNLSKWRNSVKHVYGCVVLLAATVPTLAADSLIVTVSGAKDDLQNVIVSAPWPEKTEVPAAVTATGPGGETVPAQVAPAGGPGPAGRQPRVLFVLPVLKAGETVSLRVTPVSKAASEHSFEWKSENGQPRDLIWRENGKDIRILSYVRVQFDPKATPPGKTPLENPTIKPYHHAYDPSTGEVQLTNGPSGQYPHHRGIYFGFNKISYDGKQADVWHCRN